MEHAACRDLIAAAATGLTAPTEDLDRRGVDDFLWIDSGLVGDIHRRVDRLLRALGLGDDALLEATMIEATRWIDGLLPAERLEVALQIVSRWRWLWRADDSVTEHDEAYLTTLAAWAADDLETLLAVALDRLDRAPLPQDRLAKLIDAAASGLFDLSTFLPRWRVVDAASRTLRERPASPALRDALCRLHDAERRPGSRARRGAPNQSARIAALLRLADAPQGRRRRRPGRHRPR